MADEKSGNTATASAGSGANRQADIGVTGLAVMGANLARNLARNGYVTAVHNRTNAKTDQLIAEHGDEGTFVPSASTEEFVASLKKPRTVIVMVKAGEPTDAVIDEVAPLLEPGDILVDGGNALFTDTIRREKALRDKGIHFVGTGISGGEEGALNGPSIMPGGSDEAYATVGPIFEKISAKVPDGDPNGEACSTHIGTDGAGHFVKMVHNGIEYADMQLIGEAYDLMRRGLGLSTDRIAEIFRDWNTGDLDSFLIEITAKVLAHKDPTTGNALVDMIVDAAGMKGTGTWTVQNALDLAVPASGIAEAVFARGLSAQRELRDAAAELPGPDGKIDVSDVDDFVADIKQALYAAKIVAYAQGWDLIAAGAEKYGWDIDLASVARIWRGGCIIRAAFLGRLADAYQQADASGDVPQSLLLLPYFTEALGKAQESWRFTVAQAVFAGIPVPGFAAALAYYDALRSPRLPAALIQAQRDYFGAHTYHRTDAEPDASFHTLWSGDGSEVQT